MCLITVCWGMDGRKIQNNVDLLAVSSCHASLMSKSGVGVSVLENSFYLATFSIPHDTRWLLVLHLSISHPSHQRGDKGKEKGLPIL